MEEGPDVRRQPWGTNVLGPLHQAENALMLARGIQQETDFHTRRPPIPCPGGVWNGECEAWDVEEGLCGYP